LSFYDNSYDNLIACCAAVEAFRALCCICGGAVLGGQDGRKVRRVNRLERELYWDGHGRDRTDGRVKGRYRGWGKRLCGSRHVRGRRRRVCRAASISITGGTTGGWSFPALRSGRRLRSYRGGQGMRHGTSAWPSRWQRTS